MMEGSLSPDSVFSVADSPPESPTTPDLRVMERSSLLRHAMGLIGPGLRRCESGHGEPGWLKGVVGMIEGMVVGGVDMMLDDDSPGLVFESLDLPPVRVGDYCWLLWLGMQSFGCGSGIWVTAVALLKKFLATGHTPLTHHTIHRLLLTSIVVSAKLIEDCQPSNRCSAALGGVDLANLNLMEATFLMSLDFSLHVSPETYNDCLSQITSTEERHSPIDVALLLTEVRDPPTRPCTPTPTPGASPPPSFSPKNSFKKMVARIEKVLSGKKKNQELKK